MSNRPWRSALVWGCLVAACATTHSPTHVAVASGPCGEIGQRCCEDTPGDKRCRWPLICRVRVEHLGADDYCADPATRGLPHPLP
jgi:hypothetical protein